MNLQKKRAEIISLCRSVAPIDLAGENFFVWFDGERPGDAPRDAAAWVCGLERGFTIDRSYARDQNCFAPIALHELAHVLSKPLLSADDLHTADPLHGPTWMRVALHLAYRLHQRQRIHVSLGSYLDMPDNLAERLGAALIPEYLPLRTWLNSYQFAHICGNPAPLAWDEFWNIKPKGTQ